LQPCLFGVTGCQGAGKGFGGFPVHQVDGAPAETSPGQQEKQHGKKEKGGYGVLL